MAPGPRSARRQKRPRKQASLSWAVALLDGTQDIVRGELIRRCGRDCRLLSHARADEIHFTYTGSPTKLLSLATAQTLLLRTDFAVSRPRTLLSPEHTAALVELIRKAQEIGGDGPARSFRFDAAGAGSPTMRRIAERIEEGLQMTFDPENGECVIVFRPGGAGWEVLCRVGNRPLAARPWRTVNYRGSLNAAIAACMVELSRPQRGDKYLNIMCGSGTLLIERLLRLPACLAVGLDRSARAVAAGRENAVAAGLAGRLQFIVGDARAVDFPEASFNVVTADLPWGQLLGSKEANRPLYRAALAEAARLCRRGGTMVLLTQDTPALKAALPQLEQSWQIIDERRIMQRGYRPLCLSLERR